MRDLAKLIGCGWLGLVFYGVGPLTGSRQFVVAGLTLLIGCTLSAVLGVASGRRRAVAARADAAIVARPTAPR